MDFNWKIDAPACIMISGMTASGKTQLTKKLLQRCNEIFSKPVHNILWCYTETQPQLEDELEKTVEPKIEFYKGFPDGFENPDSSQHMVLVLDDMIHLCKESKMQQVFVRGSHHQNVSCIYLTQSCFAPHQRMLSLQCKYIALMRNPRENSNYQILGRQMNNGVNHPCLAGALKENENKPFSYVVLDYAQNQDDRMRVRDSFFPEEMNVYVKK